jgi:uncharacterized protein YjbJ (UPF0337 family)
MFRSVAGIQSNTGAMTADDFRRLAKGKRQKAKGKRQKAEGRRQKPKVNKRHKL